MSPKKQVLFFHRQVFLGLNGCFHLIVIILMNESLEIGIYS